MSGIRRYYPSDIQLNLGRSRILLTEHLAGQVCLYEDVAPIIQLNKELDAENKELEAEIKRLREQKPAQEIPAELVEWANSWQEDDSDMPSYLTGCNDMKHFVKSQLEKMKGKPCK
jgi:DNA-binding transcriptional MerR regulator